ncbi:hypothetical protein V1514DRAFT_292216 [Lipomyces japonicus]|uniref:uncharacterized protein n=1 Tax=Lipomyces japonicus TaxID=56871 RepID=UPI0034CFA9AC
MAALVSPLVRVERSTLQPKIVALYQQLFKENAKAPENDGFWLEFFILKALPASLTTILGSLSADDLLQLQAVTRVLFMRGVKALSDNNSAVVKNALDTLTVLIREVLAKQSTSSEVITILVGIDKVDQVYLEYVSALEAIMRNGVTTELRITALRSTLSAVCCSYKTSLINFFMQRDLFPALVQILYDKETSAYAYDAFVLLGILSNYNKLEAYNLYQTRLADFADGSVMERIVESIGIFSNDAREDYLNITDDSTDSFSLDSLFSYSGLAKRAKSTLLQHLDPEKAKNIALAALPAPTASILLATSNFVNVNKFFSRVLLDTKRLNDYQESPFASFVSLSSYVLEHQHRSDRQAHYARLFLLIFRILIEDSVTLQKLVSHDLRSSVRICRQRHPFLPLVKGERLLIDGILDSLVCAIDHNMKKNLDLPMYLLTIRVIHRILSQLKRNRVRLRYHWSELWRSILSLLKFLALAVQHLKAFEDATALVEETVRVLVLAFSAGESFLSSAADYDDLFYKFIEKNGLLQKIAQAYSLPTESTSPIGTLLSISEHYHGLLREKSSVFLSGHLSSEQVSEVIKSGYETLSISAQQGIDFWDRYRESDERVFLKRVSWLAVVDAKELLSSNLLSGIISFS